MSDEAASRSLCELQASLRYFRSENGQAKVSLLFMKRFSLHSSILSDVLSACRAFLGQLQQGGKAPHYYSCFQSYPSPLRQHSSSHIDWNASRNGLHIRWNFAPALTQACVQTTHNLQTGKAWSCCPSSLYYHALHLKR